jgi:hypothetical protein
VALLQERFSYVYFWHRWAASALARTIGGMAYANAVRGDGQQATEWLPAAQQRAALAQLLDALEPAELDIPDTVLGLLGPRPFGYGQQPELFASRTRPAFDLLGAAQSLADLVTGFMLQPDRAARLVQQSARDPRTLSLAEMVDSLVARTWRADAGRPERAGALRRVAARAVADQLLALAADTTAAPDVRAMAEYKMTQLAPRARLLSRSGSVAARAHWLAVANDFTRWLERRGTPRPSPALRLPQYDPFGEP